MSGIVLVGLVVVDGAPWRGLTDADVHVLGVSALRCGHHLRRFGIGGRRGLADRGERVDHHGELGDGVRKAPARLLVLSWIRRIIVEFGGA